MFSEPQSVTTSQGAKSAPRILTGTQRGRFTASDGTTVLEVETTATGRRVRHIARIEDRKIAADPLTAVNSAVYAGVSLVINRPVSGFDEASTLATVSGFIAWLTAGSNANLKKLIAGEN